jgi:H+/gluconate symporter-like permease
MRVRLFAFILAVALIAAHGSLAGAATTAHGATIEVRCTASGFITDANAFHGQRVEVTAFYRATGIVCRIFDGETGELLYDPSA